MYYGDYLAFEKFHVVVSCSLFQGGGGGGGGSVLMSIGWGGGGFGYGFGWGGGGEARAFLFLLLNLAPVHSFEIFELKKNKAEQSQNKTNKGTNGAVTQAPACVQLGHHLRQTPNHHRRPAEPLRAPRLLPAVSKNLVECKCHNNAREKPWSASVTIMHGKSGGMEVSQ